MEDREVEIVWHLEGNGRLRMVEVGKVVGLSWRRAGERVRKVEEKGVITG
ncbi:winged helix-turn-helix transcriptional regulator [Bacillus subtilis]|nr:winged helix-turn-helix transcriptional regulator [Bacillus subtilis]